jgi:glycosyltransferase involved in cell wall biosynthesis
MRAPFTSLPLQTLYMFGPEMREKAEGLLGGERFDLIHVQLVRMAPIGACVDSIPKVMDFIDALSLNMVRRSRRQRGPMAWITAMEARRVQDYERLLTQQYDQLIVSSPLDRAAIGDYDNIRVIPNGVSTEEFPFVDGERKPGMIVFTGRMGYFPNADAAVWFAQQVFPLIRHKVPHARFSVVGADPTPEVHALARRAGVSVEGYVSSIQCYLHQATIAVAPMWAGSGMQFKVIEAMCSGTPVVATPYALGGIEAVDGEHLLVAEDAESFAAQVLRLLTDKELRRELACSARRLVEEKYTWERSVAMLEDVYRLAVS